jgi:16S rRNA (uracil1498-N3)-methyltransferase
LFVFYSSEVIDKTAFLYDEDLHHCAHVLRHKSGDEIYVTSGRGDLHKGTITMLNKSKLELNITHTQLFTPNTTQNCVALSLLKSIDRIEWFVEKAVELGTNEIILYKSERSERKAVNMERIQKIAISAMKQSKQYFMPKVVFEPSFDNMIDIICQKYQARYVAYCGEESLPSFKNSVKKDNSSAIIIGPEGDFTPTEVQKALAAGFAGVSLGKTILRAETAAIYGAAHMQ